MNSGMQKRKRGMPAFEPTDEQRMQVRVLTGLGIGQHDLASIIINPRTKKPISAATLGKHFASELRIGSSFVYGQVSMSLFRKAISYDHPQAASCAMFIMKCRFGWRQEDKHIHEVSGSTGVIVAPAGMTPMEWIQAQRDKPKVEEPTAPKKKRSGRTTR